MESKVHLRKSATDLGATSMPRGPRPLTQQEFQSAFSETFRSYVQSLVLDHIRQEYQGPYSGQGYYAGKNLDNRPALLINCRSSILDIPLPACANADPRIARRLGVVTDYKGDQKIVRISSVSKDSISVQPDEQGKLSIFIKLPPENFRSAQWIAQNYFGGRLHAYAGSLYLKVPVNGDILRQLERNRHKPLYATWNQTLGAYCDETFGSFERLIARTETEAGRVLPKADLRHGVKRDRVSFRSVVLDRVSQALGEGEAIGFTFVKGRYPSVNINFGGRNIYLSPEKTGASIRVPIEGLSGEAISIREVEGRFKVCVRVGTSTAQRYANRQSIEIITERGKTYLTLEPSREISAFIEKNKAAFAKEGDTMRVEHMVAAARLPKASPGPSPKDQKVGSNLLEKEKQNLYKYIDVVTQRLQYLRGVYVGDTLQGSFTTNLSKIEAARANCEASFNKATTPAQKLVTLMGIASLVNNLYTNCLAGVATDVLKNADLYKDKAGFGLSFIREAIRASRSYSGAVVQSTFLRHDIEIDDSKLGSVGSRTVEEIMGKGNSELKRYLDHGLRKHLELIGIEERIASGSISADELIRAARSIGSRDQESSERFNKHFASRLRDAGIAIRYSKQPFLQNAVDFTAIDHPWVGDLLVLTVSAISHFTPLAPAGEALAGSWFTGRGAAEAALGVIENDPQRAVFGALMAATPFKAARPALGVVMTGAGVVDAVSVINAGVRYGFTSNDIESLAQTGVFIGLPHALKKIAAMHENAARNAKPKSVNEGDHIGFEQIGDGKIPENRSAPESSLWYTKLVNGVQAYVKTADGEIFHFNNGERLAWIRSLNPLGPQKPFIVTKNGKEIPFHVWRLTQPEQILRNNCTVLEVVDPALAQLYRTLVAHSPELLQVRLRIGSSERTNKKSKSPGAFTKPTEESPYLDVKVDSDLNTYEEYATKYPATVARICEHSGLQPAQVTPTVYRMFVILHEIGHAHDYINNYLTKCLGDYDAATKASGKQRQEEMRSLPAGGHKVRTMPPAELQAFFEKHRGHFKQRGINSPAELVDANTRAYIKLPSELYADQFAGNALRQGVR